MPLSAMRVHAVGLAGLAAGEASKPGAERTIRDGRDPRAERMDEPPPREVLDRHRKVRRPVVRIVAVRVVHERARTVHRHRPACLPRRVAQAGTSRQGETEDTASNHSGNAK